jgi:putative transposase
MEFKPNTVCYISNYGQHQQLFTSDKEYVLFLGLILRHWKPYCEILSWCLMPGSFHFMVYVRPEGCVLLNSGKALIQQLDCRIRASLKKYDRAVLPPGKKIKGLFGNRTQAKLLEHEEHIRECLHRIHFNPVSEGLAGEYPDDWIYSSYRDYAGLRHGGISNKELCYASCGYDHIRFALDSSCHVVEHMKAVAS